MEIRNDKDGIHIVVDNRGRSTGEAFVQFTSPDDTEKALKKNRDKIGHRSVGSIIKINQLLINFFNFLLNFFFLKKIIYGKNH